MFFILCFGFVSCIDNQPNDSVDSPDYAPYIKKIWIIKDWNGEGSPPSFFITKIENDRIGGEISTGFIALPDCYVSSFDYSVYSDLTGTISNGVAKCEFDYGDGGDKGTVELKFIENSEIKAVINFMSKEYPELNKFPNGEYIFQPYNLTDLGDELTKIHSFVTELDSWGNVNFVTAVIDNGHKPYPTAYLTNENNDILYQFWSYQTGSEVVDVSIEDINGDGLKDVKITTNFNIVWIFIQMDNGLFYDSRLDPDPIIAEMVTQP